MSSSDLFALHYLRQIASDSTDLSLFTAHVLTRDTHDLLDQSYKRLRTANHQPMIEMLNEIALNYHRGMNQTLQQRRTDQPWDPDEVQRVARVTAFGAVNAVYSFQEHVRADLVRIADNDEAWEFANSIFASVYSENPPYLLAYKLRRIFTHDTIASVGASIDSKMIDPRLPPAHTLTCRLDRTELLPLLGGEVKAWLEGLGEDPTLDTLLAKSWEGMSMVYATVRPMLFPQEESDLQVLSEFRAELLNPNYPLTLGHMVVTEEGRPGPIRLSAIDAHELVRAGMEPATPEELNSSTAAALSRIAAERAQMPTAK